MLSRDGKVKILDLGRALVEAHWTAGEEMTVPGQVMGTPDYMAPEQASDAGALLCARFHDNRRRHPRAVLFLMDADFQPVRKLFDVGQWWRVPLAWGSGRLADWTVLPADAPVPIRGRLPLRDRKK